MTDARVPDVVPVLSPGAHRNPRKGACFMEMVSFLAGERWSDHPHCTHPLLAALARDVNDHVGDGARSRLTPLIPQVIGLTSDDPRVDALVARNAAWAALPVAAADRQGVAALGLLRCERFLNDLEDRPVQHLSERSARALADVAHAERWARRFARAGYGNARSFRRRSAPVIVHGAVVSVSESCVPDADSLLVDLLTSTITEAREWCGAPEQREAAWLADV